MTVENNWIEQNHSEYDKLMHHTIEQKRSLVTVPASYERGQEVSQIVQGLHDKSLLLNYYDYRHGY